MRPAAVLLALLVALIAPAGAHAGILSPADATELAQSLADAGEEQDACYGWNVTNNFAPTSDVGSSTGGPDVPLEPGGCQRYVILEGSIDYACDSCDAEDSANVFITSNLPAAPTVGDLQRLGLEAGDLLGDDDDVALFNMIEALPLLAAEKGNVPFVPVETAVAAPAADRPTNSPGSDWWRNAWPGLVVGVFLMGAGVVLWLYKRQLKPKEA